jgi:hypothetical protein
MTQDRSSGSRADKWGRGTAKLIAQQLGATRLSKISNECMLDDRPTVIKCAGLRTRSVGVPTRMLSRIVRVIAAFKKGNGEFELWELTTEQYRRAMYPTRSTGASAGKVSMVTRSYFCESGHKVGTIILQSSPASPYWR